MNNSTTTAPVFAIFGITGDLSKRKLLPVIYHLFSQELLPENTKIIGISRGELDIDQLLSTVELCVLEKDNICDPKGIALLRASLESFRLDPKNAEDFHRLGQRLDEFDVGSVKRDRIFYMSIPPTAYGPIVEHLGTTGLNDKRTRLLLEKPFGYDKQSAEQLIDLVDTHFSEDQVYRIDHYLAKETAQNLLTFRLFNPMFSPLWNAEHISSVHVKAVEKIGVEGRADFYEKTGALRDLIQSHLMQLLAITLMDVPVDMSSHEIHRSKQYFLEQLLPANPSNAARGQYEGYKAEVGNDVSTVETYARVELRHGSERWQGVKLILETGKAMDQKLTEITISFKTTSGHPSNNLTFQVQPSEGITLGLIVKEPGLKNNVRGTTLDFDYQKTFQDNQHIDAYERVLMDAIRGDQALFASAEEVLSTWRALQPVLDEWSKGGDNLVIYPVGSTDATI